MTKQVAPLSQKAQIEKLLRRGRVLTAAQLRELGVTKPSARICNLRNDGLKIVSTTNRQGTPAWKLDKSLSVAKTAYAAPRAFGFSY
jgi:hypothetical protein